MARSFGTPEKDISATNITVYEKVVAKNVICGQIYAEKIAANKFDGIELNLITSDTSSETIIVAPSLDRVMMYAVTKLNSLSTVGDNDLLYSYKSLETSGTINVSTGTFLIPKTADYSLVVALNATNIGADSTLTIKLMSGLTVLVSSDPIVVSVGGPISFSTNINLSSGTSVRVVIERAAGGGTPGLSQNLSSSVTLTEL